MESPPIIKQEIPITEQIYELFNEFKKIRSRRVNFTTTGIKIYIVETGKEDAIKKFKQTEEQLQQQLQQLQQQLQQIQQHNELYDIEDNTELDKIEEIKQIEQQLQQEQQQLQQLQLEHTEEIKHEKRERIEQNKYVELYDMQDNEDDTEEDKIRKKEEAEKNKRIIDMCDNYNDEIIKYIDIISYYIDNNIKIDNLKKIKKNEIKINKESEETRMETDDEMVKRIKNMFNYYALLMDQYKAGKRDFKLGKDEHEFHTTFSRLIKKLFSILINIKTISIESKNNAKVLTKLKNQYSICKNKYIEIMKDSIMIERQRIYEDEVELTRKLREMTDITEILLEKNKNFKIDEGKNTTLLISPRKIIGNGLKSLNNPLIVIFIILILLLIIYLIKTGYPQIQKYLFNISMLTIIVVFCFSFTKIGKVIV